PCAGRHDMGQDWAGIEGGVEMKTCEKMKRDIERLRKLARDYNSMYRARGLVGVGKNTIHLVSHKMFELFPHVKFQKAFFSEEYPTEYSVVRGGTKFFCITTDPWEEGEDEKADNPTADSVVVAKISSQQEST
ncbi:MAG TPA: hypothetical protein ACFYD4_08165, partial [Candidatus Wunengus sp. YC61]|uniref:hypothetical protein n=1 Tax=Candidatus Wunengus sp. YC61 TaxID=3367698 RepID=UPI004029646D